MGSTPETQSLPNQLQSMKMHSMRRRGRTWPSVRWGIGRSRGEDVRSKKKWGRW